MGIEVKIVVQMAFSCPFFFLFNPLDSVTENIPTKIDHEAISFCRSGGKKVGACVDGKRTRVKKLTKYF